jgi:uncharacterized protein (DUF3084 family)
MEALIAKIQKEVDDSNKEAEMKKQHEKKEEEFKFNKDQLFTVNLSGIENAVKFLLKEIDKISKETAQCQKDIKSRSYIVDKMHKEAGERDEKVKEMEK